MRKYANATQIRKERTLVLFIAYLFSWDMNKTTIKRGKMLCWGLKLILQINKQRVIKQIKPLNKFKPQSIIKKYWSLLTRIIVRMESRSSKLYGLWLRKQTMITVVYYTHFILGQKKVMVGWEQFMWKCDEHWYVALLKSTINVSCLTSCYYSGHKTTVLIMEKEIPILIKADVNRNLKLLFI